MESDMSAEAHVKELQNKHAKLDSKIRAEQKSLASDPMAIAALKKQKLRLKEQITGLR